MVAVSGEDLEDIARDRNKCTPELKYFFLYRMIFLTATIPPSLPGKSCKKFCKIYTPQNLYYHKNSFAIFVVFSIYLFNQKHWAKFEENSLLISF